MMNKQITSCVLVIALLMISACGNASKDGEWIGEIHVIMRAPEITDPNASISVQPITVLTTDNSEEYVLLIPHEAEKIGVDVSGGGGVVLDFSSRYRIEGSLVTKPEELEVAAQFGFTQIILASSIERMNPASDN